MTFTRRHLLTALPALMVGSTVRAEPTGFDLRLTHEGLTMPVTVGGSPLRGILDCGASATLMDAGMAEDLGLKTIAERSGHAVYGRISAGETAPVSIRAGDAVYTIPILTLPMKQAGLTSDMLIGRDILGHHRLDLNGPARRASFRMQKPAAGMIPLELSRSPKGALMVDMELEGMPVKVSLDTGSSVPLILKRDWAQRHGLLRGRRQSQTLGGDVNGLRSLTLSPVHEIRLGGATFHDLSAEISDNVLENDITLGLNVLMRLHTFWDVPAGKLWFI